MSTYKFLSCAVVFVISCSGGEPSPTRSGTATEAITDGVPDNDAEAHEAVVMVSHGGKHCSGTLIAPNLVLSARHCVAIHSGNFGCDIDGNSTTGNHIISDLLPTEVEIRTGANAVSVAPVAHGLQLIVPTSMVACNDDIALVVLDTPVTGITPQKIRSTTPPIVGESGVAVGYGATSQTTKDAKIRRRVPVKVISVGKDYNEAQGEQELSTTQGVCPGDSGSPVLSAGKAVIGVASRAVASCDEPAGTVKYIRLDTHQALIDEGFAAAGATPSIEVGTETNPPPKGIGEGPCLSGSECESLLCKNGDISFCTQECGTCPGGTICLQEIDFSYQGLPWYGALCYPIPDKSCDKCRARQCLDWFSVCYSVPACEKLLACVDGCTDSACKQACIDANPDGALDYELAASCACESCATECSNQCPFPAPSGAGGAPGGGGTAGAAAGGSAGKPPASGGDEDDGGCSVARTGQAPWWLIALALACLVKRAARPRALHRRP